MPDASEWRAVIYSAGSRFPLFALFGWREQVEAFRLAMLVALVPQYLQYIVVHG
jgi:hypothetical protein